MIPSTTIEKPHNFSISLPVELTKAGARSVSQTLTTRNLSSAGVQMNCPSFAVDIGQEVEYFVTLPANASGTPVRLRCLGRVIRRDAELDMFSVSIERHEFVSTRSPLSRAS